MCYREGDRALILASDGVWDRLPEADCVAIVESTLGTPSDQARPADCSGVTVAPWISARSTTCSQPHRLNRRLFGDHRESGSGQGVRLRYTVRHWRRHKEHTAGTADCRLTPM